MQKLLWSFLLVWYILAVQAAEDVCEPNTVIKQDCNTCRCSSDGKHLACTRRFCAPHEVTKRSVCTPDEEKTMDCNNCRCAKDGSGWMCTRRICGPREKRGIFGKSPVFEGTPNTPGFSCKKGKSFQYQCNTCTCNKDGQTAQCTYKVCDQAGAGGLPPLGGAVDRPAIQPPRDYEGIPNTPGFSCTKGKTFQHECNTCTCNKSGKSATCTYKLCHRKKREPQIMSVPEYRPFDADKCKPGSSWQQDCNTCFCSETGFAACTLKACIPFKREAKCVPGTTFRDADDCNDCFCTEKGEVACTDKLCPQREKRSANIPNTEGFTCTPFQSFKWDCNTCRCMADGKTAACTAMLCA